MSDLIRKAGRVALLISLFLLAACSAPTPPTPAPTQDLNPIRTEVAATVLAQVPQLCALTPTVTPLPTQTPTVTRTVSPTVTTTQVVGSLTPGASTADRAKYVSQTVSDGTRFAPGASFNMTWRLQNVGTSTWTTAYRLRFYSGDPFGAPREIAIDREVPPNDFIEITIPMKAPAKAGEYRSDWVLSNELLRNFNEPVFLKITVAAPGATSTVTTAPAATNTAAPTSAATTVVPSLTLQVTP